MFAVLLVASDLCIRAKRCGGTTVVGTHGHVEVVVWLHTNEEFFREILLCVQSDVLRIKVRASVEARRVSQAIRRNEEVESG